MIPKIIHCCWLGGGEKDALSMRCRESWKRFAPDCEIREWGLDEIERSGFEIPAFFREALSRRKWAFAVDWVRFLALYLEGGIYFDFDFELLAPIGDLIAAGPFVAGQWGADGSVTLEPAIMALEKGSPVAGAMLEAYRTAKFDGRTTVGEILAERRKALGLNFAVMPPEVLSPIDFRGVCHRTASTRGIHHYAMSWATPSRRIAKWLSWHGMRWMVELLLRIRDGGNG